MLILRHSPYYKFGVAISFFKSLKLKIKNNIIKIVFHQASKSMCYILLFFPSGHEFFFVMVSFESSTKRLHVLGDVGRILVLWDGERRKQVGYVISFSDSVYQNPYISRKGLSNLRATGEVIFPKFKIWFHFLKLEISISTNT